MYLCKKELCGRDGSLLSLFLFHWKIVNFLLKKSDKMADLDVSYNLLALTLVRFGLVGNPSQIFSCWKQKFFFSMSYALFISLLISELFRAKACRDGGGWSASTWSSFFYLFISISSFTYKQNDLVQPPFCTWTGKGSFTSPKLWLNEGSLGPGSASVMYLDWWGLLYFTQALAKWGFSRTRLSLRNVPGLVRAPLLAPSSG